MFAAADSDGVTLSGRGNRDVGVFLLLGRRKKVVVVDTVCVVVVVAAYATDSPALPSEREDSDNLAVGKASDELDRSPYGGGAPFLSAERFPGS